MDHTSSSGVRETSVTIPRVPMGEPAIVTSSTESSGFRRTPPFRSQVIISCSTSFTRVSVRCPDLRSSRLIPLRLILNRPALAEIGSLWVGVVEGMLLLRDRYAGRGSGKVVRTLGGGVYKSFFDAATMWGLPTKRATRRYQKVHWCANERNVPFSFRRTHRFPSFSSRRFFFGTANEECDAKVEDRAAAKRR